MFNGAIIRSGSICWYADYEFIIQIPKIGLNEVIESTKAFKDSKQAVNISSKLLKMFKNSEDDTLVVEEKVKVLFAAGALAQDGDLFCRFCYILEGDSNVVFRDDSVISRVEDFTRSNADVFSINDDTIDGFVNKVVELIKSIKEHLQASIYKATADFASKQQELYQLLQ